MYYELKNGESVLIREPCIDDAEQIINLMKVADEETKFLARNPGEFKVTVEQERNIIKSVINGDFGRMWFICEHEGKIIGQCSVGHVRNSERYLHRASVAFILLKEYWGRGIGGKMMLECIKWCETHNIEQIELDVVKDNERAIAMYLRFGFEIVGTMPNALKYKDGTYGDEYLMVKKITDVNGNKNRKEMYI